MLQNSTRKTQNQKLKPSHRLAAQVQCVPGGHQISINEAYWCGDCSWYICYKHLRKAITTTAKHCPKGHDVTKAT